jgi:transcriptional regulator with XRE-family HTH domain
MPARRKKPNPVDVHVGQRVKLRRQQLGISQTDLGKVLGVTFQQIQKNEKGTNRIGAGRLQQIANLLKVSVSYFFEEAPFPTRQQKPIAEQLSIVDLQRFLAGDDGRSLTKAFMRIGSGPLRRSICSLIEQIAERDHQ